MRRPVAEILAEAERDNWPTSSIDAMAKHDLQDAADEPPHTSAWFTPVQDHHEQDAITDRLVDTNTTTSRGNE